MKQPISKKRANSLPLIAGGIVIILVASALLLASEGLRIASRTSLVSISPLLDKGESGEPISPPTPQEEASSTSAQQPAFAPDRIIIKLKPTASILGTDKVVDTVEVKSLLPEPLKAFATIKEVDKVYKSTSSASTDASIRSKEQSFGFDRVFVVKLDIDQTNLALSGIARPLPQERTIIEQDTGAIISNTSPLGNEQQSVIPTLVDILSKNPSVEYAEPDYFIHTAVNDPFFNSTGSWGQSYADLWGIKKIKADAAWGTTEGNNVVVAVVDTGVDYNHEDLASNIWTNTDEIAGNNVDDDHNGFVDDIRGWDFANNDKDPKDGNGHGTHVAGTIGAIGNNSKGVIGVAPRVKIMPVKGLDDSGSGGVPALANAVRYAADNGAKVANHSWGGRGRSRTLEEAFAYSHLLGVVNIVAAGNSNGDASKFHPASFDDVVTVAATATDDSRACFSNYGLKVEVAAPGGGAQADAPVEGGRNILSSMSDTSYLASRFPQLKVASNYYRISGTSMATPHVSGVAALIRSARPSFTSEEVDDILQFAIDPSRPNTCLPQNKYIGTGRVNAQKAVAMSKPLPHADVQLPETLGGIIQVRGTAQGVDFQKYEIQISDQEDNPQSWTSLHVSQTPVNNGVLLQSFDSTVFRDGIYVIRLLVYNTRGEFSQDLTQVTLQNTQITFPMNNDIIGAKSRVRITGTARKPFGRYFIEYGTGPNPQTWDRQGVTESNGGTVEVVDGILGEWDASSIQKNSFYTVRLRTDNGREWLTHMVYIDGQLKAGWPQYIPVTNPEGPPETINLDGLDDDQFVSVADINKDGYQEIVTIDSGDIRTGTPSVLKVYRYDGTLLWQRPTGSSVGEGYSVIGDLNNDGYLEIYADGQNLSFGPNRIYGFDHQGNVLSGNWPVTTTRYIQFKSKTVADLDQDGKGELIVKALKYRNDLNYGGILIIDQHGNITKDFLVPLVGNSHTSEARQDSVSVGNFDGDRDLEIVTRSNENQIAIYNRDGSLLPGWPKTISGDSAIAPVMGEPVVGDIDHDGQEEIIAAVLSRVYGPSSCIWALEGTGSSMPGAWPKCVGQARWMSKPSLANLDSDPNLEIIFTDLSGGVMYVLNHDGSNVNGWPRSFPTNLLLLRLRNFFVSQSIADVNGDNRPDIVASLGGISPDTVRSGNLNSSSGLIAWDASGSIIDLNPNSQTNALFMEGLTFYQASRNATWLIEKGVPVITDLDRNGLVDLVVSSVLDYGWSTNVQEDLKVNKRRGSLYAWELALPHNPGQSQWPSHKHDVGLTGRHVSSLTSSPQPSPSVSVAPTPSVSPTPAAYGLQYDRRNKVGSNVTVTVKRKIPAEHITIPHDICFSRNPGSITHTGTCKNVGGYPDQWREESITFPISYQQNGTNYIHLRRQGSTVKYVSYTVQ